MWKETPAPDLARTTARAATANLPVNEDEVRGILDRLGATVEVLRENQELRDLLSSRDTETKELRSRNEELEGMMRKFAPLLLNAATALGLAAKNEKPSTKIFT